MTNIDNTLTERGTRYGAFEGHANITQNLKTVMQSTPNWDALKADQKEALDMAAHKIGRILNGDPDYIDSWHDIIGYTRLVEQRLEREQKDAQEAQVQKEKISGIARESFNAKLDKFTADVSNMRKAPETNPECDCPACTIRSHLEKMLGTSVEVIVVAEDSGLID